MGEKLTHKEHDARAMLMGLVYDWRDGTYCKANYRDEPTTDFMLDAMSLETVTPVVNHDRITAWGYSSYKYHFRPRPKTPYAEAE